MQATINCLVVDIYPSTKNASCYLTVVDLDNGEKVKLILPGVPDCQKMETLTFEGELIPGQYGFKANGVLKRTSKGKENN
jgi:hypothetical protein